MLKASLPFVYISRFSYLPLADPHFNKFLNLDHRTEIVEFLLIGKSVSTGQNNPVALETLFGWILMAKVQPALRVNSVASCFLSTKLSLESSVARFWVLEKYPSHYSPLKIRRQNPISLKLTSFSFTLNRTIQA